MTLFLMQTDDFVMDEYYSKTVLGSVQLDTHGTGFPQNELMYYNGHRIPRTYHRWRMCILKYFVEKQVQQPLLI